MPELTGRPVLTRLVDADTTCKQPITGRPDYGVRLKESAASSQDEAALGPVAVPAPLLLITAQGRRNDHEPFDRTHPNPDIAWPARRCLRPAGRTGFARVICSGVAERPLSQFPQTATGVAHFLRSGQVQVVRRDFGRVSDAELLRAGTADAFEEVYDRLAAHVLAWARARVGEHAADVTAEVFVRAWLRRSRFRHESDMSAQPWLLGIARNVLRESLRKRRVEDAARSCAYVACRPLRRGRHGTAQRGRCRRRWAARSGGELASTNRTGRQR